jgi:hypothetical protein
MSFVRVEKPTCWIGRKFTRASIIKNASYNLIQLHSIIVRTNRFMTMKTALVVMKTISQVAWQTIHSIKKNEKVVEDCGIVLLFSSSNNTFNEL